MRIILTLAAASAALVLLAGQASAQSEGAASPASGNVLIAQAAAPPQLTPPQPPNPPGPQVAQNMAQNVGVDDFQFNELDFDRQGTGGARQAGPPALPGTMILTPSGEGDSLTDLFSDQPAPAETLRNLPGAPSPTSTPAAEGQAKIELSQSPGQAAAAPAAKPATRRRRASRVAPMRSPEDQKGNQWYWAHEVWREHPAVHLSDCQSYVTNRPLYNIRCVSTVAGVNAPRPFVRYPR